MRITLVGPGRAGTALALAARAAGHEITAVMARRIAAAEDAAAGLGGPEALPLDAEIPDCDLALIATRDDAIASVAADLAGRTGAVESVVHMSGLAPVTVLDAFAHRGMSVGSFHPLQTLPTPEAGAGRLSGAWIAVTAEDEVLRTRLHDLAASLGANPFDLADAAKPLYHAAAAAAANFPLVALAMAADLFAAAGVPFEASKPLVDAVVANAFALGPRAALTGPVARGDVGTVEAQIQAVVSSAPDWETAFRALVGELAKVTGRVDQFRGIVEPETRPWN